MFLRISNYLKRNKASIVSLTVTTASIGVLGVFVFPCIMLGSMINHLEKRYAGKGGRKAPLVPSPVIHSSSSGSSSNGRCYSRPRAGCCHVKH